ncbi:TPA: 50S ribosomal protein L35 [Candidatus Acetothermia bacterium]|nr:50S ribosomal protein L35 [Candidatus Bipolaricaulota bacterium]HAF70654.1 50S ribosomal protein L35 [Candidatus Acetothermia bacterium]
MKKKKHKSAAKRFKVKPSGKIFRRRAGYVHKLSKKRPQYRRQARRPVEVTGADARRLRRLLTS